MCVKGMKGKNYSKLVSWFDLVSQNVSTLVKLFQQEPNQLKNTLDVLKSGLFSNSLKVVVQCADMFYKLLEEMDKSGDNAQVRQDFN